MQTRSAGLPTQEARRFLSYSIPVIAPIIVTGTVFGSVGSVRVAILATDNRQQAPQTTTIYSCRTRVTR